MDQWKNSELEQTIAKCSAEKIEVEVLPVVDLIADSAKKQVFFAFLKNETWYLRNNTCTSPCSFYSSIKKLA